MNEKKYIVKYNFPHCEKQTVTGHNCQPIKMTYEQAKMVAKKLNYKFGAYTTIEEIK